MIAFQATCVAINGRGLLIEGAPGSGKSSLALALIDRGAMLVGDDGVLLDSDAGSLFALPHPRTKGMLEVRNLGLLSLTPVERIRVALAVRLDKAAPRFVDAPQAAEFAGVLVPQILLYPDSPMLHLRAELAMQRFGLD